MAFIKEESEDVKIEDTFRVKDEDTDDDDDDDGIDLMAIIETQKQYKKWEQEFKDQYLSTEVNTKETPPPIKTKRPRIKGPFICSECGSCFSSGSRLRLHLKIHSEDKPFTCLQCGKRFCHKGNFETHLRVHTGEKPYRCELCGRGLATQQKLNYHMSRHIGRKRKFVRKKKTKKVAQ